MLYLVLHVIRQRSVIDFTISSFWDDEMDTYQQHRWRIQSDDWICWCSWREAASVSKKGLPSEPMMRYTRKTPPKLAQQNNLVEKQVLLRPVSADGRRDCSRCVNIFFSVMVCMYDYMCVSFTSWFCDDIVQLQMYEGPDGCVWCISVCQSVSMSVCMHAVACQCAPLCVCMWAHESQWSLWCTKPAIDCYWLQQRGVVPTIPSRRLLTTIIGTMKVSWMTYSTVVSVISGYTRVFPYCPSLDIKKHFVSNIREKTTWPTSFFIRVHE